MNHLQPLAQLPLTQVDTLVFAGGGNRCWWQAGAVSALLRSGWRLPPQLVGTSAGAGVAVSLMTGRTRAALATCVELYAANKAMFDWRGLAGFRLKFAQQQFYPAWITSFLNGETFDALHGASSRMRVAVTRPSRWLGLTGSVAAGTLAYLVDRTVWHALHPRLPRLSGLRQDFVDLHACKCVEDAQALLRAAAAAPPFMHPVRIGAGLAFDGGYTDNAPIYPQSRAQRRRTLVLLTRHDPKLPRWFRCRERMYWQPSRPVPVKTWGCTARTTVREAFAMGERDTPLAS